MAIVHPAAELRPTKLELLSTWLPGRPWAPAGAGADLQRAAAFRFDDPDGEVGVETLILRVGAGSLLQVPLTYRGRPADGQEAHLIGTLEHSVLGRRWVYDACGDPVYLAALVAVALGEAGQAAEVMDLGGRLEQREPSAHAVGSGPRGGAPGTGVEPDLIAAAGLRVTDAEGSTMVRSGGIEVLLTRALDPGRAGRGGHGAASATLSATWSGQSEPVELAGITIT